MRRGIVFVGGAGRQFLNQSATVVADRIARAVQDKLGETLPFTFRIRLESDVYQLAQDTTLDIASIEVAKGGAWEPVLDVLEVKYLSHFTERFSRLPPLARILKAFSLVGQTNVCTFRARRSGEFNKVEHRQEGLNKLDQIQAAWLGAVMLATIGAMVYWLIVGVTAVFGVPALFNVSIDAIVGLFTGDRTVKTRSFLTIIAIAVLLLVATALQKTYVTVLDQMGIDSFSAMEYWLDDRRFVAAQNAVLEAIDFAYGKGYPVIDLLSFSLGAVLATDVIYPRRARERVWVPPVAIENWITLGYPYDIVRLAHPALFSQREEPVIPFKRWINLAVQDDFLGTTFTQGDGRGIRVRNRTQPIAPDVNPKPFAPEHRVGADRRDWVTPMRRAGNHHIYWNGEDARASTCFSLLVDMKAAGWAEDVVSLFCKSQPRPAGPS